MIRTKNVLFLAIEFTPVFNTKGNGYKSKKQPCPPPVQYTNKLKLTWKENRDQKKRKKQEEKSGKYNNAIAGVYCP